MPSVPEIITQSVLMQLEQGVAPWRKPWSSSIPRNLVSKKSYRGLNVFLLATQGYTFVVAFGAGRKSRLKRRAGTEPWILSLL